MAERIEKRSTQAEDIVRLPLVSPYNTRILDSTNIATNTSSIVGIGVVGTMIVGQSSSALKDKKFINCFAEKVTNNITGGIQYYVSKRPGFASYSTPANGNIGTTVKVWSVNGDKVISAFGATNSTIYDHTTSLGAITGKANFIEETLIGTTPYIVIPSTDNTAWYSTGGAPTLINDADFPGNAGRTITGNFVFVDGYAFIMDTGGRIYNSDLNSVTAWTTASYISANMYPDNGIGLARYKNMVVAFGRETIEFFYNSGQNPVGSPLSRYDQGFMHIGCLNQFSYTQIEDTIAWVSASDKSGVGVYMLDGLNPHRISTPAIDSQLSLVGSSSVYATSAKIVGKTFLIITCSSTTFVYIVEDDMWHEWSSSVALWHTLSGTSAGSRVVYATSRASTTGKVFIVDPMNIVYTDNGYAFTMTLQTAKFDADTINWKFLNKLSLVADTTPTTNTMAIQWSDDDYQTWSTARNVDLTNNSPYIMNCGKFRRRAFKFTNSINNPVRLEAVELQLKTGIH